jgi:hypothetical protein
MTTHLKFTVCMLFLACVVTTAPLRAADDPATTEPEEEKASLTELNKKLTNPISDIWSLTLQQNNYVLDIPGRGSSHWNSNLQLQPVLPVGLTRNWNLITRPVLQLFNSIPYLVFKFHSPEQPPNVDIKRTTGFGDTILLTMLSPSPHLAGNWLLGLGPTFIFPTASSVHNGQGKWQAGPGAVAGYLSKKWILGAFVQNWTSFAGQPNRDSVNQMNLQPIASYFLPGGWSIGYSGNVLANWKSSSSGDKWTVPVGVGISKVVKICKIPVKLQLAGQWMPVHPDNFGQMWNIQLLIAPVIPKLIKGNIICD